MIFVARSVVHQTCPVFAREDLVHPNEGTVDIGEGYVDAIAISIFGRYLASKDLDGEDRGEECNQEHEDNQIQETGHVAQHNILYAWSDQWR